MIDEEELKRFLCIDCHQPIDYCLCEEHDEYDNNYLKEMAKVKRKYENRYKKQKTRDEYKAH